MGILNRISSFFRMSGEPPRKEEIIGPVPKTAGYAPVDTRWFRRPDDLPMMTWVTIEQMLVDPTIRLGLAMRAAPLRNAEFAYKEKGSDEWTPGIRASTPQVGAYVHRQFKKIWRELDALLIGQLYGWSACEVVHHLASDGGSRFVEISRLVPRHPRDTRALIKDGDICGVRFLRIVGEPQSYVDLPFPKAIFHRHSPQAGRHYGNTILEGAYSPFADKWGQGGALKLRRLVMQQSAISGRKLYYPDGVTDLPIGSGGEVVAVPNRDVARMIVEQMLSGGVSSFPSNRDADGNRLWEMEEAKALEGLQHILQYPKDLDVEELRGMEIPDDILTAEASGAWEGKKVPMMAFYGGLDSWLGTLVREISVQQMDYLVLMNFGPGHWYEAITKPLAEQAMDQAKAGEPKQQPCQALPQIGYNRPDEVDRQPQRMSLDPVQAVGEGVLSAAELVKAAQHCISLSLDKDKHEHKAKGPGGGQFTSKGNGGNSGSDSDKTKTAPPARTSRVPPKPLSDKAARAKASHHMIDKAVQRYAEEHNEPAFAKAVGGVSFPDGEAIDVAIAGKSGAVAHGIELKTMVDNKANKITMKREAMERKAKWERKNKAPVHTVVIDDSAVFNANGPGKHDKSKRRIFYRRGYGSFRVNTMHEVGDIKELKTLMELPNRSLPPAAQRPAGQKPGRLAA